MVYFSTFPYQSTSPTIGTSCTSFNGNSRCCLSRMTQSGSAKSYGNFNSSLWSEVQTWQMSFSCTNFSMGLKYIKTILENH